MSLFDICLKAISKNPIACFKHNESDEFTKCPQECLNKIISSILQFSSDEHICQMTPLFEKCKISELKLEKPLSGTAIKVALVYFAPVLKNLLFPQNCHFNMADFMGKSYANLRYLLIDEPKFLCKEQLLNLTKLLPYELNSLAIAACQELDNEVMECIAKKCPGLLTISFAKCSGLSTFSTQFTNLLNLDLNGTKITDETVKVIGNTYGKQLEAISIGFTQIQSFPNNFINLKEVDFRFCRVDDEALIHLAEGSSSTLEKLYLGGSSLISKLPCTENYKFIKLSMLDLNGTNFTGESLEMIGNAYGKQLQSLSAGYNLKLKSFPSNFINLKSVDLCFCKVNDEALIHLAEGSGSTLEELMLEGSCGFRKLPSSFKKLLSINLAKTLVTKEGWTSLAQGAQHTLKKIKFSKIHGIDVSDVKKWFPNVETIDLIQLNHAFINYALQFLYD